MLALFFQKKQVKPIIDSVTAAGCIFTNETHILAGYQPNKTTPYISGFGGNRLEGEPYEHTAVREMIEELFDIEATYDMITRILNDLKPLRSIKHTGYMVLQYTFEDLDKIIKYLEPNGVNSTLYKVWPKNLYDLIFTRTPTKSSEISIICLLPFVKDIVIDDKFKKDIDEIIAGVK
jgi:hypothetical protein